jgi:uncharacterized protein YcfJ
MGAVAASALVTVVAQPALADRHYGYSYYSPRPAAYTVGTADRSYRVYDSGNANIVYAEVVDVQPIVRQVTVSTPRQECWQETVYRQAPDGTGAVIAGGILGGITGHQFGSGHGQDAMTVIGAVVGSTVAHNVVKRNATAVPDTVERCETRTDVHEEERIEGYDVTYVYDGQRYRTRMREHPGKEVAVRVAVTPVEN